MNLSADNRSSEIVRESEGRLRFLLRLSDALRALDEVAELQATASSILLDELGAARVGYADIEMGRVVIRSDATAGLPSLEGHHRQTDYETALGERLRSGEIDVHADVVNDPELSYAEKLAHAAMGIGATVNVPLFAAGELQAFFFLHHHQAHAFADREIEFVRETAERAWFAIEAARSKAARRESEARLAAALDSVPVGVGMIDADGRIVLANAEYRRFLPGGIIPSRDPLARERWHAWDDRGEPLVPSDFPGARAMRGERVVPGQEMLFSVNAGHQRWTRVASVPIHDACGRIYGQASVISDIDDLKRGRDALRESQARAQLLVDGIARATWEAAADGLVEVDSPSWRDFTGQSYDDWKGHGWLAAIHPDDRAPTFQKWQETVRQERPVDAEYRLRGKDGLYRWMNVRAVPLRDDVGRIVKWLGMNIDIDERKRLEEAHRSAERRTQALMAGIPQLLWRADRAIQWTWASPQWTAFTGQTAEGSRELGWLSMVHPDDRRAVLAAWAAADVNGGVEVEHRLRHHDGSYRWFTIRAVPVRDEGGDIVEWLGTANDIDALRQAQARQGVMVAELQHRTRNLIAVVHALAEKTLDHSATLEEFEFRFSDRLAALGRVQGLLSHASAGRRVTFDELIRSELAALGASDSEGVDQRITLDGPRGVPLRSSAVQTFALALHELATNAVKHGALSLDNGALAVAWSVERDADDHLELSVEWRESGLTPANRNAGPARKGFGRELIEHALPYQLGAKTSYALSDTELCCTIRVPIVSQPTGIGEE
jgi:PAS domain S-box-containing protein